MSSSAGLLSPRGPFSGAAPLALRPLSAIAATNAGGVPQGRIKRLLADLVPDLTKIHEQGDICGDLSLDSVGMDEFARAHILIEFTRPRRQRASVSPMAGYAPFERYTDATQWPRGAWTDVYSLSAIAYTLVTGERPPAAPERMASDSYHALAERGLEKYEDDFLRAIDQGLALRPQDRPQTIAEFSALLALPATDQPLTSMPQAQALQTQAASGAQTPVPEHAGRRTPWILGLLVCVLLAAGMFWWFWGGGSVSNSLITRSELMVPTAAPPELESPLPGSPPEGATMPAATQAVPHAFESKAEAEAGANAAAPVAPLEANTSPTAPSPDTTVPAAPPAAVAPQELPKVKPATVAVRLDIRPWGEIWINGVARGVSPPVKELRLPPGKYNVVVRNADLPPYRLSLDVKPGKPAVIAHVFK